MPENSINEVFSLSLNGEDLYRYRGPGREVRVPKGVERIHDHAFAGTDVTSVLLPDSVRAIWCGAFSNCAALERVHAPGCSDVDASAFEGCVSLRTFELGAGIRTLGPKAFRDCRSLERIKLHPGASSIPAEAFSGCTSLKEAPMGKTTRKVQACAFRGCSSLVDVALPASVRVLGAQAFADCTYLEIVRLPKRIEVIGRDCFWGCARLNMDLRTALREAPADAMLEGLVGADTPDRQLALAVLYRGGRARQRHVGGVLRTRADTAATVGAVAREICARLGGEEEFDDAAWATATLFFTRWRYHIEDATMLLFEKVGAERGNPYLADLRWVRGVRHLYAGSEPEPSDPALRVAYSDWRFTEDVLRLRQILPRGAAYADGSGRCHPDAIAHAAALLREEHRLAFTWDMPVFYPTTGAAPILRMLDREDLAGLLKEVAQDTEAGADLVAPIGSAVSSYRHGPRCEFVPVARESPWRRLWVSGHRFADPAECRAWSLLNVGMPASGVLVRNLGGRKVSARLHDGQLVLYNEKGRQIKAMPPSSGPRVDVKLRQAAAGDLKEIRSRLARMRGEACTAILQARLEALEMDPKMWAVTFMGHPSLEHCAARTVWEQAGRAFTLLDGRPVDSGGNPVELGCDPILVADTSEMRPENTRAWREYFRSRGVAGCGMRPRTAPAGTQQARFDVRRASCGVGALPRRWTFARSLRTDTGASKCRATCRSSPDIVEET